MKKRILSAACDVLGHSMKTLRSVATQNDAMLLKEWRESNEMCELYDKKEYETTLLWCWYRFSSKNAGMFIEHLQSRDKTPGSFIDYHGGCGLTACQLALTFPESKVFHHTIVDSHKEIASKLFDALDIDNVVTTKHACVADVAVAQEVFEHMPDPVSEVIEMLRAVGPEIYYDCSTFTIDAPGHFFHNRKVRRSFHSAIRTSGYVQYWKLEGIDRPYNGQPAVWYKKP